jgi:hypothetical protein
MLKQLIAAVAALTLAAPIAAQAQEVPSYAAVQNDQQADQQIQGRVTGFDGSYNLSVADNNGYTDNVQLHDGTIINPTGLELAPGMVVSVLGYSDGSVFDANEIDTPYSIDNAVPYYAGHPWNFYGPTIGLSFFFGNTGWWQHPVGFRPGFGNDRGIVFRGNDGGGFRGNNGGGFHGNTGGTGFNGGTRPNNVPVRGGFNQPQPVRAFNPPQAIHNFTPPQTVHAFQPQPAARSFNAPARMSGGGARESRSAPSSHERR